MTAAKGIKTCWNDQARLSITGHGDMMVLLGRSRGLGTMIDVVSGTVLETLSRRLPIPGYDYMLWWQTI